MRKTDLVIPASMQGMYDRFHFAPAVRVGELLLCSGQIGIGPDGRAIADPAAQFTAAFESVKAVLAAAGLGFGDVVEMTTYHAGGMRHLATFMQVKDRYLSEPYPAWTAIGVTELAFPGGLAEIRVTARRAAAPARTRRAKPRAAKKSAATKRAVRKATRRR